jgi:hypothetical protein
LFVVLGAFRCPTAVGTGFSTRRCTHRRDIIGRRRPDEAP